MSEQQTFEEVILNMIRFCHEPFSVVAVTFDEEHLAPVAVGFATEDHSFERTVVPGVARLASGLDWAPKGIGFVYLSTVTDQDGNNQEGATSDFMVFDEFKDEWDGYVKGRIFRSVDGSVNVLEDLSPLDDWPVWK